MIRVDRHPLGPRLYVGGRRIHHGSAFGLVAVAALVTGRHKIAISASLVALHDYRDFPFTDNCNH